MLKMNGFIITNNNSLAAALHQRVRHLNLPKVSVHYIAIDPPFVEMKMLNAQAVSC